MQLFETEAGRLERSGERSTGTSSRAQRGEGRTTALVARRSLAARARGLRESVWAPVLAKGAAIFCGMLALAAIGASSLSRGSGVPLPASSASHARVVSAAGVAALGAASPVAAGTSALEEPGADAGSPTEPGKSSPGMTADGKVILNRADAGELRHLPGIGPKRAEAIVALRAKLGGHFKRVSDLLRVKGIGPKGLKKLEPHVVLDEPKQS